MRCQLVLKQANQKVMLLHKYIFSTEHWVCSFPHLLQHQGALFPWRCALASTSCCVLKQRFLLSPLHTSSSFLGVEEVLSGWALCSSSLSPFQGGTPSKRFDVPLQNKQNTTILLLPEVFSCTYRTETLMEMTWFFCQKSFLFNFPFCNVEGKNTIQKTETLQLNPKYRPSKYFLQYIRDAIEPQFPFSLDCTCVDTYVWNDWTMFHHGSHVLGNGMIKGDASNAPQQNVGVLSVFGCIMSACVSNMTCGEEESNALGKIRSLCYHSYHLPKAPSIPLAPF